MNAVASAPMRAVLGEIKAEGLRYQDAFGVHCATAQTSAIRKSARWPNLNSL